MDTPYTSANAKNICSPVNGGRETGGYQYRKVGAWPVSMITASAGSTTECIGAIRTSAFPLTHLWSNPKVPGAEVLGGRTGGRGAWPTRRTGQSANPRSPDRSYLSLDWVSHETAYHFYSSFNDWVVDLLNSNRRYYSDFIGLEGVERFLRKEPQGWFSWGEMDNLGRNIDPFSEFIP